MFISNLTKDYLYRTYSQESIFQAYGVPITTSLFISPIRQDKTPTCKLQYYNGVLRYFDNRPGEFRGDAVSFVQHIKNLTYKGALWDILNTMSNGSNLSLIKQDRLQDLNANKSTIKLNSKPFTEGDLEYWGQYNITLPVLEKYKVISVKECFIKDSKKDELCFAYLFPDSSIKVYFPGREKYRFIGNSNYIQGLQFITPDKPLLITKSYKDCIALSLYDIQAVAAQSESILPPKFLIEQYNCSYLADNDWAGKKAAVKVRTNYNIPIYLFDERYRKMGIKDFTDSVKILGKENVQQLINNIYVSKKTV
jgi:hypothetical protein